MKNTKIGETKTIGFTVSGKNLSYNAVVVGKHWFKKNEDVEKSEWENQSVVFEFDENGLKKHHSVIEKNGDVRTEVFYDENGHIAVYKSKDYEEHYNNDYDESGRLIHVLVTKNNGETSVEYFYDYDENGLLAEQKSVIDNKVYIKKIQRNAEGKENYCIEKSGENVVETWTDYDEHGRKIHQKSSDGDEKWWNWFEDGELKSLKCGETVLREKFKSDDGKFLVTNWLDEETGEKKTNISEFLFDESGNKIASVVYRVV